MWQWYRVQEPLTRGKGWKVPVIFKKYLYVTLLNLISHHVSLSNSMLHVTYLLNLQLTQKGRVTIPNLRVKGPSAAAEGSRSVAEMDPEAVTRFVTVTENGGCALRGLPAKP